MTPQWLCIYKFIGVKILNCSTCVGKYFTVMDWFVLILRHIYVIPAFTWTLTLGIILAHRVIQPITSLLTLLKGVLLIVTVILSFWNITLEHLYKLYCLLIQHMNVTYTAVKFQPVAVCLCNQESWCPIQSRHQLSKGLSSKRHLGLTKWNGFYFVPLWLKYEFYSGMLKKETFISVECQGEPWKAKLQ